jgi:hypothetical protein
LEVVSRVSVKGQDVSRVFVFELVVNYCRHTIVRAHCT